MICTILILMLMSTKAIQQIKSFLMLESVFLHISYNKKLFSSFFLFILCLRMPRWQKEFRGKGEKFIMLNKQSYKVVCLNRKDIGIFLIVCYIAGKIYAQLAPNIHFLKYFVNFLIFIKHKRSTRLDLCEIFVCNFPSSKVCKELNHFNKFYPNYYTIWALHLRFFVQVNT